MNHFLIDVGVKNLTFLIIKIRYIWYFQPNEVDISMHWWNPPVNKIPPVNKTVRASIQRMRQASALLSYAADTQLYCLYSQKLQANRDMHAKEALVLQMQAAASKHEQLQLQMTIATA